MSSVAVIGAGAWGTALAIQAARAGNAVTLWARDAARARTDRRQPREPAAARHPPARADPGDRTSCPMLPMSPCWRYRCSICAALLARLPAWHAPLVACAKGVEQRTLRLPLEIVASVRPGVPAAVLTGPNFAHEIAAGLPAAAVVAAGDAGLREAVAALLGTPSFRLYGNDDPIGAQVGGAAKNVIAIAAGAVIGAGLGENARAALITRGLAELARLAVALGGRSETVMGLSGLGDLLLTCTGAASRNYSLGLALGRGERLADVLAGRSAVTEGVATAPALVARAQGVDMPICTAVAALLAGRMTLTEAITALLARPRRDE